MTCHLPDPSAYHPSPSPASHRSHFPFTASAACSAPCTLPHFYTSSLPGPHSNVPLPGAFPMTPPRLPLPSTPEAPSCIIAIQHALRITWGLQVGTAVPKLGYKN